jgi:hypothetical protein
VRTGVRSPPRRSRGGAFQPSGEVAAGRSGGRVQVTRSCAGSRGDGSSSRARPARVRLRRRLRRADRALRASSVRASERRNVAEASDCRRPERAMTEAERAKYRAWWLERSGLSLAELRESLRRLAGRVQMGGTDLERPCKRGGFQLRGPHRGRHRAYTSEQLRPVDLAVVDESVRVAVGGDDA